MNIIFLDIDGVLNCQLFFKAQHHTSEFRIAKKALLKQAKAEEITREQYHAAQICKERVAWLSELCEDTQAQIVISSTWRKNTNIEYLQEMFDKLGGTFEIVGLTPISDTRVRGVEIAQYLEKMTEKANYVIIDDNDDMLLGQAAHFFQTDEYSGLTPTVCRKIKDFFKKT